MPPSHPAQILPKYAAQITEALVKKSAEFCTEDPPSYPKSPPRGADGTTSTVMESFTRSPLSTATIVPGQVPGLGEVGVKKVSTTVRKKLASASSKTPSSVQLLGLFLTLGRDETAFEKFLTDECGCRQQDASRTVEALQAKAKLICDMHTSAVRAFSAARRAARAVRSPFPCVVVHPACTHAASDWLEVSECSTVLACGFRRGSRRALTAFHTLALLPHKQATATPAGKRTGTRLESTPEVGAAPGMPTEAEDETNVKAQVESTRSSLGLLLLLGLLVAVAAVVAKVGGYV